MKLKPGRKLIVLMCVVISLSLNACNLIPAEEEQQQIQIKKEDHSDDYLMTIAENRDVVLSKTLSCTYLQLNKEDLSFSLDGEDIAYVYVKAGDRVKAGDLLAKLDTSEYEAMLNELENQIEKYNLLVSQQDELIEFYQKRIDSGSTSLYQKAEYTDMLISGREERSRYADEAEYANIKRDTCLEKIEAGKLYAGIDGTVSYVRSSMTENKSRAGSTVVTVLDTSVCAFQSTDPEAAEYLKVGDEVEIVVSSDVKYAATVSDIDKESGKIMFELDEPDYSLAVGTRANIEIIYEQKLDVLSVPVSNVYSTEDFHYVYCLNDEGIRELVKVEVGLFGNKFVEITGGLEPGAPVIIR